MICEGQNVIVYKFALTRRRARGEEECACKYRMDLWEWVVGDGTFGHCRLYIAQKIEDVLETTHGCLAWLARRPLDLFYENRASSPSPLVER